MMLIPKSKSSRIQILVLILAGLILQPAHASVIPGRWEKASNLKVDAPITVTLKNGDQVEGHFKGLSASDVDIETHSARAKIPEGIHPDDNRSDEGWLGRRSRDRSRGRGRCLRNSGTYRKIVDRF